LIPHEVFNDLISRYNILGVKLNNYINSIGSKNQNELSES
jgi:hypothetical protein